MSDDSESELSALGHNWPPLALVSWTPAHTVSLAKSISFLVVRHRVVWLRNAHGDPERRYVVATAQTESRKRPLLDPQWSRMLAVVATEYSEKLSPRHYANAVFMPSPLTTN